jgi:hypothetical protein
MFQEPIAAYIADHFRTHIEAYLETINNQFPAPERETVRAPKTIETASLAGGVFSVEPEKLPAFAIDVNNKTVAGVSENLDLFQYSMQIAGMVNASSQQAVDHMVKRYEAGTEYFFKQHDLLHVFEPTGFDFSVIKLAFASADFSGAEELTVGQSKMWIDGFVVTGFIVVSESGPGQHE